MQFQLGWKLDICIFQPIYGRPANSSWQERTTCLKLSLESASKVWKQKYIVSLRVMDSIHYKESLMLLRTYVAAFDLLILQVFHIKQEELFISKTNFYFTRH